MDHRHARAAHTSFVFAAMHDVVSKLSSTFVLVFALETAALWTPKIRVASRTADMAIFCATGGYALCCDGADSHSEGSSRHREGLPYSELKVIFKASGSHALCAWSSLRGLLCPAPVQFHTAHVYMYTASHCRFSSVGRKATKRSGSFVPLPLESVKVMEGHSRLFRDLGPERRLGQQCCEMYLYEWPRGVRVGIDPRPHSRMIEPFGKSEARKQR